MISEIGGYSLVNC
uniref:Uncharacterized protein n=1 Tax=Anguilla anguilla TaxID=7936 RepID=A0A0E9TTB4_ANGAN